MNAQIAQIICNKWRSNMKYILDLEEFSYRDKGRDDPRYKTFKKHVMANTYESLYSIFEELVDLGVVTASEDNYDLKNGYRDSLDGGSGYINTKDFDDWVEQANKTKG